MKGKDLNPDVISQPGATISSGWGGGGGNRRVSTQYCSSAQEGIMWTVTLDLPCVSTAGCVAPAPMSTLEVPSQQRSTFVNGINEEQSKEHMEFSKFLLPYYTKVIIFVDQPTGLCVSTYNPTLCGDVGRLWLHTDGPQLVINR